MLSLLRPCRVSLKGHLQTKRALSALPNESSMPWFVDKEFERRVVPPHLVPSPGTAGPSREGELPFDLPKHLVSLHSELRRSPHLEPGGVEICPPLRTLPGPPLPSVLPKGRRKRGRTELGLGIPDVDSGLWRWVVLAQVKEGTENRGGIESVMRIVRRTLLKAEPPVPLPPNRKYRAQDGWGMLDAGDFAVHVLSRSAREKYFPIDAQARVWQW
ncbi:hypothetical protein M0805_006864 [Coniferiporia weirii]|nr:hypothetical protein M0805_006864 [Coniferiporia weirii]